MKDRFKLRAVNVKTKEIIYIEDLYWFEEEGIHNIDDDGIARGISGEYHINQCTGLPDKNDKLIYEGDIIRFIEAHPGTAIETCICGVFFVERKPGYSTIVLDTLPKNISQHAIDYNGHHRFGVDMCTGFHFLSGEIIGNIYENPELLEVNNAN